MAKQIMERIRTIGPYVALELVMPGGTMLAFLLFLYRRKFAAQNHNENAMAP
jgi:hypothetical protein